MKKVIAIFAIAALTACGGAETPAETVSPAAETGTPEAPKTDNASGSISTDNASGTAKDAKVEAKDAKKADAPKEEKKK